MPAASPVRRFPTTLVTALAGVATAVAVGWSAWLDSALHVAWAPVAGIALTALLLLEPRRWPIPLVVVGVVGGGVGTLTGDGTTRAAAQAAGAAVAALLAAVGLRLWAAGTFRLRRAADVVALAVTAGLGALVGAGVSAAVLAVTARPDGWTTTAADAAAAALGTVIVAAAVCSFVDPAPRLRPPGLREALALAGAVVVVSVLGLWVWSDARAYAVVAILVWAAFRFRVRGVASAAVVMLLVADAALADGSGPLAHLAATDLTTARLTLQTFAAVAVVSLLALAAALDERDATEARRFVVNERFRRTFDAAPIGIAVTTLDGVVIDANPALCSTFGTSRRELVGTTLDTFRASDEPETALDVTGAGNGRATLSERRYVSARGERVWAEVGESVVRSADGEPDSAIVVVHDVTARKQLEERVLHAQKMDTVGRLAGSIAHDFNNLIAVMRGHAELLEDDLAVLADAQQRVASMRRVTDRAAALTDDLLTFSRRSTDEPETIDVHALVTSAGDMLTQIVGANVTVDLRLEAHTTRVDVDPRRLEQVLVNLVVNAADAMPFGGRVTIATRNVDAGADTRLELSVTDTGAGIAPELLDRIFEPFFTTKPAGSGTGLGLSTAADIVRRYGGTIAVDSEVGVGTTFVVTLPVHHETARPVLGSDSSGNGIRRPRETILVVDDDPDVRTTVADILRDRGYHVLEAQDGAAALDVAARTSTPIDLVLSDVVMPGMGGPELAERISAAWPDVEVLFVSGHPDIAPTAPCLRGARLLRKPVARTALIAEVEAALVMHTARLRARSGSPRPAP